MESCHSFVACRIRFYLFKMDTKSQLFILLGTKTSSFDRDLAHHFFFWGGGGGDSSAYWSNEVACRPLMLNVSERIKK